MEDNFFCLLRKHELYHPIARMILLNKQNCSEGNCRIKVLFRFNSNLSFLGTYFYKVNIFKKSDQNVNQKSWKWFKWPNKIMEGSKIRQSTIYYAGLQRIVDQESDVPNIMFFILFIDIGHSKLFIFIFEFYRNK